MRGFKQQLGNAGFTCGEEIAACPGQILLGERNIGPGALTRIR
ncbi:hypothetical protein [Amycolatopsis magusensis]